MDLHYWQVWSPRSSLRHLHNGFIRFTILTAILGDSKGADSLQVPWLQQLDYARYLGIVFCQSLSGMCRCCEMLSVRFKGRNQWKSREYRYIIYIYTPVYTVCISVFYRPSEVDVFCVRVPCSPLHEHSEVGYYLSLTMMIPFLCTLATSFGLGWSYRRSRPNWFSTFWPWYARICRIAGCYRCSRHTGDRYFAEVLWSILER